ncbi:MAG: ABC transporter permease [Acidobacteriota bacterium]
MAFLDDFLFRLRSLVRRPGFEADLDDELRFHLEMDIERRMAAGASRAEAERAARLDFGAPESIKEATRDAWGTRVLEETARDLRSAGRHFQKAPAFTLAAVGSLAVGLGAAAVIFSLVDAVLLRSLPYGDPDRIVRFWEVTPEGSLFSSSDRNVADFRGQIDGLSHIAAVNFPPPRPSFGVGGERRRLQAQAVSPSFFKVFGVDAALGRTFDPADEPAAKANPAPLREVVISDRFWRQSFGADPGVVGREIELDGEGHTVIGVLPADFRFEAGGDVYVPYLLDLSVNRGDHRLGVFGRLAPGRSLDSVSQETAAVAARLASQYPDSNSGWGTELVPIDRYLLSDSDRRLNHILLGAVLLLLLLAVVNVSSLVLARAADRGHELRLRLALGAGRKRIVRQLMTESVLLGVLGAVGGLALAKLGVPVVRGLDVPLPRLDGMRLDGRVFAFLAAAGLVSSVLFGLLPALRTSREAAGGLSSRRYGNDVKTRRLRSALVMGEVALATVLCLGAGLLLHSFEALDGTEAGFASRSDQVVLTQVDLSTERYPENSRETRRFYDRLVARTKELPGVEAAAVTTLMPFAGPDLQNYVAPTTETDQDNFVAINWRAVSGDFFNIMEIPLLRGRSFDDDGPVRHGAVLSERLAARLWPGEDPVGQQLRWIGPKGPAIDVIGVVGEVRDMRLAKPERMTVYLPQRVMAWTSMVLAVKGKVAAESLQDSVCGVVQGLDPLLAPPPVTTLERQRRAALAQPLLGLSLLSAASGIALILAAIGVYGLLAYALSQRTREMGVRVALGARPFQLVGLVGGDGLRLVGWGLLAGTGLALLSARSLGAILYETSTFEPAVLAGVAAVLGLVGVLASCIPAWRAARVDPVTALRRET